MIYSVVVLCVYFFFTIRRRHAICALVTGVQTCALPISVDGEVTVDGGEIHDLRWLAPREVLARRDRGEVDLAPPTWVTLADLADLPSVDVALALAESRRPLPHYETRWVEVDGGAVALWEGDAGYDLSDHTVEGRRHRLWMTGEGWRYEQIGR